MRWGGCPLAGVLDVDEHGAAVRGPAHTSHFAAVRAHQEAGDFFGGDVGHQHLVVALVDVITGVGKAAIGLDPQSALWVHLDAVWKIGRAHV